MLSTTDAIALKEAVQEALPVNSSRKVYLLKVPKFVASQWRTQSAGTIVGVVLDPPPAVAGTAASLPAGISAAAALDVPSDPTDSSKGLSTESASPGRQGSSARRVMISAESIASYAAAESKNRGKRPHPSQKDTPKNVPQFRAMQRLRSLSVQNVEARHLHLLSYRPHGSCSRADAETDGMASEGVGDTHNGLMPRSSSLFTDQDGTSLANSSVDVDALDADMCDGESAVSSGLTAEAQVAETWTLVPQLDTTYHTFLKLRNEGALHPTRTTREMRFTGGTPGHTNDGGPASLFRYYQPNSMYSDGLDKSESQRCRTRGGKLRSLAGSKLEPGSAEACEREDAVKQRLFQAFEARSTPTEDGTLALQDILKVTGESYHYVKAILSQIAEPVRTTERKRLLYKLKLEFRSRH